MRILSNATTPGGGELGSPKPVDGGPAPAVSNRGPASGFRLSGGDPARRGVALVITLIMLSVITFMAITFLVLSQRERGAVGTQTDQTTARLTAETGTQRALSELVAHMLAFTNDQLYGLCVSTNFINPRGFDPSAPVTIAPYSCNPTNVNFGYLTNGQPLNRDQQVQNNANLLFNPRPPVFVDGRQQFYLDLNRNGKFDTNGPQPVIGPDPANPYYDLNGNPMPVIVLGNTLSNNFVGDPEWIGVLPHPEWPHSSSNLFMSRYAYVVVPSSQTLDVNFIHNQAVNQTLDQFGGNFMRNQGVAPWEINLAAFLYDLNTNLNWGWGGVYTYSPLTGTPVSGNAFIDAVDFLRYRYNGTFGQVYPLPSVFDLFPPAGVDAVRYDRIDEYSDGILQASTAVPPDNDSLRVQSPWLGADNPNHFFGPDDFYDPAKFTPRPFGFIYRLTQAGARTNSYDRYTFWRMLEQLGTDSAPEPDRLNLNYKNVDSAGNIVRGMETRFIAWTNAAEFFTNAADRMLRATYPRGTNVDLNIGVTRIQVWPINQYTPSVHRQLQLAANLYDSTTNRSVTPYPHVPSVFRPLFRRAGNGANAIIYIAGFREVNNAGMTITGSTPPMVDLNNSGTVAGIPGRDSIQPAGTAFSPNDQQEAMIYGMPLVIGAKKGFPNFNKFVMQNGLQVSRKLEFHRSPASGEIIQTNQMYVVTLNTDFGVDGWNSYSNAFPRNLVMTVAGEISVVFTNENGVFYSTNFSFTPPAPASPTNVPGWPGIGPNPDSPVRASFLIPVSNSVTLLRPSTWRPANSLLTQFAPLSGTFEQNSGFPVPRWWVTVGARVRFFLVDSTAPGGRIVDYVNLSRDEPPVDITTKLMEQFGACNTIPADGSGNPWCTNRVNGLTDIRAPTYGILNQIQASRMGYLGGVYIFDSRSGPSMHYAVDSFRYQFLPAGAQPNPIYPENQGRMFYRSNTFYAPLDPATLIAIHTRWEANDPLVHYTVGDLVDLMQNTNVTFQSEDMRLGTLNRRYEPWGGNPLAGSTSPTRFELAVKDPLVVKSDDWDFPTNKFANLGGLGRVHRGTPWQTVYLKARDIEDFRGWVTWTGNDRNLFTSDDLGRPIIQPDASFSRPANDRVIFDIFTTAINENAGRGRLSINQRGLAAWSAVLSGVLVLTNTSANPNKSTIPAFAAMPIAPAGNSAPGQPPPVARIVDGINHTRALSNQFPQMVFTRLGDILAVPELSVGKQGEVGGNPTKASPFLNLGVPTAGPAPEEQWGISEDAYERIPRQILSLVTLNHTPRFVIYSYGQTLRPAANSLVSGGPFLNICTNYQVTAEIVTRTVVRVEGSPDPRQANNPNPLRRYPLRSVVEQFNILPPH